MANLNPATIMRNWQQGMGGATTAYTEGVQAVQESPTAKAASQQALSDYANACQRSATDGSRANALNAVSLESWKQSCATTGAQRLASGAQKGAAKYQAWLNNGGAAAMAAAKANAAAVQGPKGEATALAKVKAAMDAMKAAKKR